MKRLLLALLLTANAAFAAVPETFSDPAMEARARHLQQQLRCLVCQGQSIDESDAALAGDLRQRVRELMAEGRSDQEIRDYLKARYGDFILMKPPVEPATWLLWLAPFLVLGAAGGVAWMAVSRARKTVESGDPADSAKIADF